MLRETQEKQSIIRISHSFISRFVITWISILTYIVASAHFQRETRLLLILTEPQRVFTEEVDVVGGRTIGMELPPATACVERILGTPALYPLLTL